MARTSETITLSLPIPQVKWIRNHAKKTKLSLSTIASEAIEDYKDEHDPPQIRTRTKKAAK